MAERGSDNDSVPRGAQENKFTTKWPYIQRIKFYLYLEPHPSSSSPKPTRTIIDTNGLEAPIQGQTSTADLDQEVFVIDRAKHTSSRTFKLAPTNVIDVNALQNSSDLPTVEQSATSINEALWTPSNALDIVLETSTEDPHQVPGTLATALPKVEVETISATHVHDDFEQTSNIIYDTIGEPNNDLLEVTGRSGSALHQLYTDQTERSSVAWSYGQSRSAMNQMLGQSTGALAETSRSTTSTLQEGLIHQTYSLQDESVHLTNSLQDESVYPTNSLQEGLVHSANSLQEGLVHPTNSLREGLVHPTIAIKEGLIHSTSAKQDRFIQPTSVLQDGFNPKKTVQDRFLHTANAGQEEWIGQADTLQNRWTHSAPALQDTVKPSKFLQDELVETTALAPTRVLQDGSVQPLVITQDKFDQSIRLIDDGLIPHSSPLQNGSTQPTNVYQGELLHRTRIHQNELLKPTRIVQDGLLQPISVVQNGLMEPTILVQDGLVQPTSGVQGGLMEPTSVVQDGLVQPTSVVQDGLVQPTSVVQGGLIEPTSVVQGGLLQPTSVVQDGLVQPTSVVQGGLMEPTSVVQGGLVQPTSVVQGGLMQPTRVVQDGLVQPTRVVQDGLVQPTSVVQDGLVQPTSVVRDGLVQPTSVVQDGLVQPKRVVQDGLVQPKRVVQDGLVQPTSVGQDGLVEPTSVVQDRLVEPTSVVQDGLVQPNRGFQEESLQPNSASQNGLVQPSKTGQDNLLPWTRAAKLFQNGSVEETNIVRDRFEQSSIALYDIKDNAATTQQSSYKPSALLDTIQKEATPVENVPFNSTQQLYTSTYSLDKSSQTSDAVQYLDLDRSFSHLRSIEETTAFPEFLQNMDTSSRSETKSTHLSAYLLEINTSSRAITETTPFPDYVPKMDTSSRTVSELTINPTELTTGTDLLDTTRDFQSLLQGVVEQGQSKTIQTNVSVDSDSVMKASHPNFHLLEAADQSSLIREVLGKRNISATSLESQTTLPDVIEKTRFLSEHIVLNEDSYVPDSSSATSKSLTNVLSDRGLWHQLSESQSWPTDVYQTATNMPGVVSEALALDTPIEINNVPDAFNGTFLAPSFTSAVADFHRIIALETRPIKTSSVIQDTIQSSASTGFPFETSLSKNVLPAVFEHNKWNSFRNTVSFLSRQTDIDSSLRFPALSDAFPPRTENTVVSSPLKEVERNLSPLSDFHIESHNASTSLTDIITFPSLETHATHISPSATEPIESWKLQSEPRVISSSVNKINGLSSSLTVLSDTISALIDYNLFVPTGHREARFSSYLIEPSQIVYEIEDQAGNFEDAIPPTSALPEGFQSSSHLTQRLDVRTMFYEVFETSTSFTATETKSSGQEIRGPGIVEFLQQIMVSGHSYLVR